MQDQPVTWYKGLIFQSISTLTLITLWLVLGVVLIMNTRGKTLIAIETSKYVEQIGNNVVSRLIGRSDEIVALTKTLAATAETLPKSPELFKQVIPALIDFHGDLDIAGGGVWPEPYTFDPKKERNSFFWGRDSQNILKYYDDYNQPGPGYHHEEWYVAVSHAEPGTCVWSESYMDPYSYQPMVTCTVATFDKQNRFSGTVTIDLKLEGLQAIIEAWQKKTGGYIFLLDRNNKFITFSQPTLVKRIYTDEQGHHAEDFMHVTELSEKFPVFHPLAEALETMNQEILTQMQENPHYNPHIATTIDQDSYQIDREKANLLAAVITNPIRIKPTETKLYKKLTLEDDLLLKEAVTTFIFHVPKSYWKLVIVKPTAEINAVAANIIHLLIVYVVATTLVILSIAYFELNRFLIKPLGQTINAIRKMGELVVQQKFQQLKTVKVHHKSSNEIGLLIQVFNTLTTQVVEQQNQLAEANKVLEAKNEQLKQLDELKDEFLANTSHELRTPLNGIVGIAESLMDGVGGTLPAEAQKNLLMIIQSGYRLTNLINDILDFSKLKHKNLELQLKPLSMREIVEVVLTFCQPLKGQKKLQLINAVHNDLLPARADENRVQQILYNLVGNAIKFTEQGTIEISSRTTKDDYLITVITDTGIGIPANKLRRIFEPFEQVEGSMNRNQGGTGLGLAVTKKLVELHGGNIWVESEMEVGSQFYFTLPIAQGQPAQLLERSALLTKVVTTDIKESPVTTLPEVSTLHGRFKILIVDDEPINLQVLVNHLSLHHYVVTQASSGPEALALLEGGFKPDLILLDVMMPKMTGYEVVRQIRKTWGINELPTLLLTAKNQVSDLVTGLEAGANDYLTKPVSKDELLARIKTHLNIKRLKAENLRMGAELEVSRKLQKMLLPTEHELTEVADLEIAAYMEPANEVGGDYYDVLQHEGYTFICIGDVTGHGLESGALAIMVQASVRALLASGRTEPPLFLDSLNQMIYRNVARMKVLKSMSFALLTYQAGQIVLSGQHEEVIIVRNGEVELIDTVDIGFPIGLEDSIVDFIFEKQLSLQTGDVLVLYTDGITEAENTQKAYYGLERLCEIIKQNWQRSAKDIQQIVIDDVQQYIGRQVMFDDITLLVLKQK